MSHVHRKDPTGPVAVGHTASPTNGIPVSVAAGDIVMSQARDGSLYVVSITDNAVYRSSRRF